MLLYCSPRHPLGEVRSRPLSLHGVYYCKAGQLIRADDASFGINITDFERAEYVRDMFGHL